MSVQPLLQDSDPCVMLLPSLPIDVTVTANGSIISISEETVVVPWLFAGNIVFTLFGTDTFQDPGITFTTPNSPFIVSLTDENHCVVTAVNDNPALTNGFPYILNLLSGNGPIGFDPTVENDSPPPPIED
jgi:hypothetical protein